MDDFHPHNETPKEKAEETLKLYFIPFILSGVVFFFLLGIVVNFIVKLYFH